MKRFDYADFHAHFRKHAQAEARFIALVYNRTHLSKGKARRRLRYWMREMERTLFATPNPPDTL